MKTDRKPEADNKYSLGERFEFCTGIHPLLGNDHTSNIHHLESVAKC